MATNKIATYGVKVDPKGAVSGSSRASTAIKGIGKTASRVKNQIFSLNGAMGALGVGAVMKSVIQSASGLESLRVRLKFLTGSTVDAGKAFDTMTKFASKVPFALEDIQSASPLLLTITDDIDELNGLLEMTGDIAAVSGLDFVKTAEQLQRAMASGIASADLFRERGVAAFLGFEQGVTYSADETKKKLNEMWEGNTTSAVGATKELAKTFQGQVSMMEDAWFKLKIQLAETGIFEEVKDIVLSITGSLGDPQTIAMVKEFGNGIMSVGKAMGSVFATLMKVDPWILEVGVIMAFLGGKKARVVLAGITALTVGLDKVATAFTKFDKPKDFVFIDHAQIKKEKEAIVGYEAELKILALQKKAVEETSMFGDMELNATEAQQVIAGLDASMLSYNLNIKNANASIDKLLKAGEKADVKDIVSTPEVTVDPTIKKFKKLIATNDKYIQSIKNVGINLSDEEKLLQNYGNELERINAFAETNKLTEEQRAEAIGNTTTAYEEAVARLAELDNPMAGFADSIDDIFGNGGTLASGIGDATAQILVFGEKSSITMKKLGQMILGSVVSSVVEMGVQMAINWAKDLIFKKADVASTITPQTAKTTAAIGAITAVTTANVAAGVATTAAWTPAAAMVSLASFGANSVPAMAGITATTSLAVASAQMASLPSAEGGGFTGSGSRSGGVDGKGGFLSILHPKETVIDHTKGQGSVSESGVQTTNEVNIDFTVNAMDSQSFQQSMVENSELIVGVIRNAFNANGQAVQI